MIHFTGEKFVFGLIQIFLICIWFNAQTSLNWLKAERKLFCTKSPS